MTTQTPIQQKVVTLSPPTKSFYKHEFTLEGRRNPTIGLAAQIGKMDISSSNVNPFTDTIVGSADVLTIYDGSAYVARGCTSKVAPLSDYPTARDLIAELTSAATSLPPNRRASAIDAVTSFATLLTGSNHLEGDAGSQDFAFMFDRVIAPMHNSFEVLYNDFTSLDDDLLTPVTSPLTNARINLFVDGSMLHAEWMPDLVDNLLFQLGTALLEARRISRVTVLPIGWANGRLETHHGFQQITLTDLPSDGFTLGNGVNDAKFELYIPNVEGSVTAMKSAQNYQDLLAVMLAYLYTVVCVQTASLDAPKYAHEQVRDPDFWRALAACYATSVGVTNKLPEPGIQVAHRNAVPIFDKIGFNAFSQAIPDLGLGDFAPELFNANTSAAHLSRYSRAFKTQFLFGVVAAACLSEYGPLVCRATLSKVSGTQMAFSERLKTAAVDMYDAGASFGIFMPPPLNKPLAGNFMVPHVCRPWRTTQVMNKILKTTKFPVSYSSVVIDRGLVREPLPADAMYEMKFITTSRDCVLTSYVDPVTAIAKQGILLPLSFRRNLMGGVGFVTSLLADGTDGMGVFQPIIADGVVDYQAQIQSGDFGILYQDGQRAVVDTFTPTGARVAHEARAPSGSAVSAASTPVAHQPAAHATAQVAIQNAADLIVAEVTPDEAASDAVAAIALTAEPEIGGDLGDGAENA